MKRKIGCIIDSLKLGVKPGIERAAELGVDGFQIYVTHGEMAPENMSADDRRDFVKFVKGKGLEISALCGDLGKGILNPETNPEVIARSKEFIDLAVDLETTIVTTHIGHLPDDESTDEWSVGIEAARELAKYAMERGCYFATETGPEAPHVLLSFLQKVGGTGLAVNYDPANFQMLGPFDHIGGVSLLADYIVHTHAKDGICLMSPASGRKPDFLEVPLGEGSVAFKYYLKALDDIGYNGYLTIEREVGDDPAADVAAAVRFLRGME